jgi:hypothetical protein
VIAKTGAERSQDSKAKKGGRQRHPMPLLEEIKSQCEEQAINKKGPLISQRPGGTLNFRSYDNPHTICQNLPETTGTSAGAEGR